MVLNFWTLGLMLTLSFLISRNSAATLSKPQDRKIARAESEPAKTGRAETAHAEIASASLFFAQALENPEQVNCKQVGPDLLSYAAKTHARWDQEANKLIRGDPKKLVSQLQKCAVQCACDLWLNTFETSPGINPDWIQLVTRQRQKQNKHSCLAKLKNFCDSSFIKLLEQEKD